MIRKWSCRCNTRRNGKRKMGLEAGTRASTGRGKSSQPLEWLLQWSVLEGQRRGRRKDAAGLGVEEWKGVSFRNDWNLLSGYQRASETWMRTGKISKDAQGRQGFQLRQLS